MAKDRMLLLERLDMYISAGLPADKAVSASASGMPRDKAASLTRIRSALEAGQKISGLLHSEVGLSEPISRIISCGESSGDLAASLRSAHSVMSRASDIRDRLLTAMAYPAAIGLATMVLTIGLLRGVMPQIEPVLSGLDSDMPLMTSMVMMISDLIGDHPILLLACAAGSSFAAWLSYRYAKPVKSAIQSMSCRIPMIGKIAKTYSLSAVFRSMGALIGAGMAIDMAYPQAISGIGLLPLRAAFEAKRDRLDRGESLGSILAGLVPPYAASLVSAGEASGSLGKSLSRIADIMDREIDKSLKRLVSLMEPAMMLIMGTIVGIVALSMMMPIYGLSEALQR